MITARVNATRLDRVRARALLVSPSVWVALKMPWWRWAPSIAIATR